MGKLTAIAVKAHLTTPGTYQDGDPQAWSVVVQAARMARANRQIISGCIKKANASGKPVRCTVSIVPDSN